MTRWSTEYFVCAHAADGGGKGKKSRHRRGSTRHGIGVKGGRRGSLAIDKSWEAINKARGMARHAKTAQATRHLP